MLELIVVLGLVYWVATGGMTDFVAVCKGQTPPRVAAGRARAAAAGRRYGVRGYLGDLWSDAWVQARAKREARVKQRLADIEEHGPGPTWRQKAHDRMSAAWGRWEQRMAERQARREQATARPDPEPVAPAAPTGPDPGVPRQRVDQERVDQDPEQEQRREPVEPVTVTPWHPDRDRPEPQELTARPGPGGRWEVIDTPDRRGEARGDGDMAEVTGLVSALAHATEMRKAFEESTAGAEQYLAGLQAGGVTGEALAAVQQAMEAQQAAAASWAQAEATLSRHMQVKEAYEANRDAGTREFVTAE